MKILHYFLLMKYLNSTKALRHEFDELYKTMPERKTSVKKQSVNAQELFFDILKERQKQVEFI